MFLTIFSFKVRILRMDFTNFDIIIKNNLNLNCSVFVVCKVKCPVRD